MKHSNDAPSHGPSIRRTLNIGNFESITIELPLSTDYINPHNQFWQTVLTLDNLLIEWAQHIAIGHQCNIGKGAIDRLNTEIQIANQQLQHSSTTE